MLEFTIGLFTGIFIGVIFGICTICIIVVGKDKEE